MPTETLVQVAGTAGRSRSESTRRNYAADWQRFTAWCQREGHAPLPAHPLTVAAYLHDAASTVSEVGERAYSPSTLARWVAGIGYHHRRAGHPAPGADELVTATLSGIRRDYGRRGSGPAPRGRRCSPPTSSPSSRRCAPIPAVGPRRSSNAATPPSSWWASPGRFAAANSSRSPVATCRCTGSTGCTSNSGNRRPIRKGGGVSGPCRSRTATSVARRVRGCGGRRSSPPSTPGAAPPSSGCSAPPNPSRRTSAGDRDHAWRRPRRGCGRSASTATSPTLSCRGRRYTKRSGAAPNRPATTPTSSNSSVVIRCGPDSSPRPSATAPPRTRSCARPVTPPPPCSRPTPANTHHSSATPSPISACDRERQRRTRVLPQHRCSRCRPRPADPRPLPP
ncbi:phage integrase family protein [Rhodococcus pyridinivorans AK37]|uniref:Phage integrase family protein n=1 Tax=Rhodococcus pyridinivorans AK37 TaxID=1114960 RepID=H0JUE5_9NOCA|nr:phage integrase family protein [Rhodococcus pyridinivorans AK37]